MIKTPLRTEETYAKYLKERKGDLSDLPVAHEWVYWKLAHNEYPYDAVFDKHDLLILKRDGVGFFNLSPEEHKELGDIISAVKEGYDAMLYPFQHSMTYPGTLHLHLLHTINMEETS